MGALSDTFVDPNIGTDTGAGTIGDPYGNTEHALATFSFDTTNGHYMHVRGTATDTISSALSLPAATASAPFILTGYDDAAHDGGQGVISGGGSTAIINSGSADFIGAMDMRFTDAGSATLITLDSGCTFWNCEFDDTSGSGLLLGTVATVCDCYVHNIGGTGIMGDGASLIEHNFLKNGTNTFGTALDLDDNAGGTVENNIISLTGGSNGIAFKTGAKIKGNYIYSVTGTGDAIFDSPTGRSGVSILDNVVVGFNGVGGNGMNIASQINLYGGNVFYLVTAPTDADAPGGDIGFNIGGNQVLSGTPFEGPSSDIFHLNKLLRRASVFSRLFKGSATTDYREPGASQRREYLPAFIQGGLR